MTYPLLIWSKYPCRGVLEFCQFVAEDQFHAPHRSVAVLGDDDLRDVLFHVIFLILIRTVDEHHDVGVLLKAVMDNDIVGNEIMMSRYGKIINRFFTVRLNGDNAIPLDIAF